MKQIRNVFHTATVSLAAFLMALMPLIHAVHLERCHKHNHPHGFCNHITSKLPCLPVSASELSYFLDESFKCAENDLSNSSACPICQLFISFSKAPGFVAQYHAPILSGFMRSIKECYSLNPIYCSFGYYDSRAPPA